MQPLSVFDIFKIGVGPSSSHTLGPWKACAEFAQQVARDFSDVDRVSVDLFGSLAKTGHGHATHLAVQMGLGGDDPAVVDVDAVPRRIALIRETSRLLLSGAIEIDFHPKQDILFHFDQTLPQHPNAMTCTAWSDRRELVSQTYFSIGGGFIVTDHDWNAEPNAASPPVQESAPELPFPIDDAADLLNHCQQNGLAVWEVVHANELTWRDDMTLNRDVDQIANVMLDCIHNGCRVEGTLPGGLDVRRRAALTARRLLGDDVPPERASFEQMIRQRAWTFDQVLDWVNTFALAVNEENAAMGRVVTAPTNGAAGVIPAVLMYHRCFTGGDTGSTRRFLMTASEIGCIFKKGATLSAAMGGCQAEIGVSSAMAAAALAEVQGGSPGQALAAAEISMEHHLGLTCDPVGGLVQIPCIERNAMGAIKAISASRMAVDRDPADTKVSLDAVVRTMWQTALDMNAKYKETSEGGLAIQIPVNLSEC
ncbi:MAG: L-serine ammonia-lyase [Planctomycetota bacterium]